VHSIVKITEKDGKEIRLDIIKDAKRIFARYEETGGRVAGVEYIKGIDSDRLVQYEVWTVGDLYNLGTKRPLKVAMVVEKHLKTFETSVFYVLSTDQQLTPEQLRELAHARWSIENSGFKMFNSVVKSKRIYTHDEKVFEPLYLIFMMAFNLLLIYYYLYESDLLQLYPGVKLTLALMISELYDSIIVLYNSS